MECARSCAVLFWPEAIRGDRGRSEWIRFDPALSIVLALISTQSPDEEGGGVIKGSRADVWASRARSSPWIERDVEGGEAGRTASESGVPGCLFLSLSLSRLLLLYFLILRHGDQLP